MPGLQQQLADLRQRLNTLPADSRPTDLTPFESEARTLLTASKNTPYESEARALFAELAQRSTRSPTAADSPANNSVISNSAGSAAASTSDSAVLRGILRRARIRMELAADDGDYDEAIDILAGALDQDPTNAEARDLLRQAAAHSPQQAMKVRDLLAGFGIAMETSPARQTTATSTPNASIQPIAPVTMPDTRSAVPTAANSFSSNAAPNAWPMSHKHIMRVIIKRRSIWQIACWPHSRTIRTRWNIAKNPKTT